MGPRYYIAGADLILVAHLAFIGWVIFGGLFTRGRKWLALIHIITLIYGIVVEVTTLACPLTLAENWCEARAGIVAYHGPFVLHYLDALVYPRLPAWVLTTSGVAVCVFNLGVYVRRFLLHKMLK